MKPYWIDYISSAYEVVYFLKVIIVKPRTLIYEYETRISTEDDLDNE